MTYPKEKQDVARKKYIGGLSLAATAKIIKVPYETLRAWKKKCLEAGDDWDRARSAILVSGNGIDEINKSLVEQISRNMLATIAEIENGKINPVLKVELLTSISDAYSKFARSFSRVNPEFNRLGVALEVIKLVIEVLKIEAPKLLPEFERYLDIVGAEVTKKYTK